RRDGWLRRTHRASRPDRHRRRRIQGPTGSSLPDAFSVRGRVRRAWPRADMAQFREIGRQGDAIFRALADVLGRVLTRTRSAIVSDAVWYRSADLNDYRKPAGVDHCLVSVCQVSHQGAIAAIALARGLGERDFSPGEVRLLEFGFHFPFVC